MRHHRVIQKIKGAHFLRRGVVIVSSLVMEWRLCYANANIFVCAVNSVASSICSRHDPAVLRHEVAKKRRHVEQLRWELEHMESEMQYTQHGHRALSLYAD